MAKISNKNIYNQDQNLSMDDYLVGTNSNTSNKKTQTYSLGGIYTLFYNFLGFNDFIYTNDIVNFPIGSPGCFYVFDELNNFTTEFNESKKITFSQYDTYNFNVKESLEIIINSGKFLIKFINLQNKNNFVFFKPTNFEINIEGTTFNIDVELQENLSNGNFINYEKYFLVLQYNGNNFNPNDYDLIDFNNNSTNPFIQQSDIGSIISGNGEENRIPVFSNENNITSSSKLKYDLTNDELIIGDLDVQFGYNTKLIIKAKDEVSNSLVLLNSSGTIIARCGNETWEDSYGKTYAQYSHADSGGKTYGEFSNASGLNAVANSFCETAIGLYNEIITPASINSHEPTDLIFNVGIGTDNSNKLTAFSIFKNGMFKFIARALTNITNAVKGSFAIDENGRPHFHDGTQWNGLTYIGETNYVHPNHTGDVTSISDGTQTISNQAVTNSKFRNSTAHTVVGRAGSGNGSVADIGLSNNTILGREGSGNIEGLSVTQVKNMLSINNIDNTSDLNKPISTATQTALNGKEDVANKSTNTSLGTSDTLYPSQKAVKTYVDSAISGATVPTLSQVTAVGSSTSTPISVLNATFNSNITPSQITTFKGTKGVVNDAEGEVWINTNGTHTGKLKATNLTHPITLEMPVKNTGTYTIATTDLIGAANGLAELDSNGKVPSAQLPSFVDDVEEYANLAGFPVTGESGKIYIALDSNLTYRWGGTTYVEISPSLALGETSASAYRGDRGKIAYDHSQLTSGNPHNVTKSDVGLSNCDNTSDANKPISTATQTVLNSKISSDPTGITGADQVTNIVSLTQAEYDAITPNTTTIYIIV